MIAPQNDAGELHVLAETNEIAALCLEGEFDMANAPQIVEEGEQLLRGGKQLILDLTDATFVDSSAVHALFRLAATGRKQDRVVVLQLGTAAIVERAVDISGLDHVLPRASTRGEALAAIERLAGGQR